MMHNQIKNQNKLDKNKTITVELNNAEFFNEVCKSLPTWLIKTQFGIGKYIFEKLVLRNGEIVLLFKLSNNNNSTIHNKINHYLGNKFIVTINQYLHAYRWYAIA